MKNPRPYLCWTGDRVLFNTSDGRTLSGEIIGYSLFGDTLRHYYVRTPNLNIYEVQEKDIKHLERDINNKEEEEKPYPVQEESEKNTNRQTIFFKHFNHFD